MRRDRFRVVQGCPAGKNIAPYIAVVTAGEVVESIYRGADAEPILKRHGKHSQPQLYRLSLHGTPAQRRAAGLPPGGRGVNEPGFSSHEMRSDGVPYPGVPRGDRLPDWWMEGFDMGSPAAADLVIAAGHRHGWVLFRPYVTESEAHHLNFRHRPRPRTVRMLLRIVRLRRRLPRR